MVKPERVQIVCSACSQQVEAVAGDSRGKGYRAVAKQYMYFPIKTQLEKKLWQNPEYRAKSLLSRRGKTKQSAALRVLQNVVP